MNYKYQIVIKTWQQNMYIPSYEETYRTNIELPNDENVKQFIERYGNVESAVVFLEELLNTVYPRQSQEQESSLTSLTYEQLMQKVKQLLESQEVLLLAKQELVKEVSKLSHTKENREVERLREEKAELKREKDQLNRDNKYFESQIAKLQRDLDRVHQQPQNNQYYQDFQEYQKKYNELAHRWNKLVSDYDALQKQLAGNHTIEQENQKLKKSRQTLEHRVQEIEQELQETQQKLSLATMRLRGINTHSELGGGGSRSDQLKNEFSHLKMGLLHDASGKVLNDWRDQGSKLTFRSEEFSKIKSILSQRVFGDGMNYFAQDKSEVDVELHLVMDGLSSIKDFSPTPVIFQEIQEKVQVGLLRAKGVDHSDESIEKYIEETTQSIDQELKSIANLETTIEALGEIKKFVKAGLKIVQDIVNDANSGKLFIPETGTPFDDNAHDTRDDHKGQIKMTICAGYRIKGTVLVKADVMTYEPKPAPQSSESISGNLQTVDSRADNEIQEPQYTGNDDSKVEETGNILDSPLSTNSSQEHSEVSCENQPATELKKSFRTFKGKVNCNAGVMFRSLPKRLAKTGSKAAHGEDLNFEAWIVGEPWKEENSMNQQQDDRWYKLAGQNYWLPAFYIKIEGDLPTELEITEPTGDKDEVP